MSKRKSKTAGYLATADNDPLLLCGFDDHPRGVLRYGTPATLFPTSRDAHKAIARTTLYDERRGNPWPRVLWRVKRVATLID